ncbi:hypothetical protein [Tabrizicola sp.]|uniref:hypothetical protein n=1 Tax=Tabrizicola sp. TaxID=2005166 RepID=UPI002734A5B0|nr:hypothetical protein [Tabrizicola sp.]MDP2101142.1 hypothetical protein [Methylotenera sp.]MDP2280920.1 hypothetical protein [Methylotenera sp.]MDP3059250.1 hypothetical protein [Methylotenera sp.]MDP3196594.1 hypothetical protein [Tabrizicola sp.]
MSEDNSEYEIIISPKHKQVKDELEPDSHSKIIVVALPSVDEIFADGKSYELNQHLKSIVKELPDQRISEVNQKQDFVAKKKLIKEIMASAKDAAQQAAYKLMSEHPEAEGLGFKFTGRVYANRYKGLNLTQAFIHMLDCMLDRRAGFTTQRAILDSVQQSTGILELNDKIWNMPLRQFVKALLYKRLENHRTDISLAGCSNMSEIRKVIDIHFAKMQAVHKLKLDLTITANEIIVNGTNHKITTVTSGAYKYRKIRLLVNNKRTWLNVNELKVFFGITA